jgi:pimeloyl-ACP methyl ester carboxylesterase
VFKKILRVLLRVVVAIALFVVVLFAVIYLWSLTMPAIPPVDLTSKPNAAKTYDEAMARFDQVLAAEKARGDLDPKCYSFVKTHGQQTERSIVLLHGFTACPYQYEELAQQYFDLGYNVYAPLLPHHGLADRTLKTALSGLTAEELFAVMDPATDIAVGLGKQATVAGLSLGGNVAATAGQFRSDLFLGVPMSPAMGIRYTPDFLSPAVTRIILGLPDMYFWWDPINKDKFQAESGYPGYSTHALGQVFRLGLAELEVAGKQPPAAQHLLVIRNWGDPAVNVGAIGRLASEWRRQGADVQLYSFPLIPWLPHDFISPTGPGANPSYSYPIVIDLTTAYQ